MFSSITFLVVFSVFVACSAKSIVIRENKCAYSTDPSVAESNMGNCPQHCSQYRKEALLKTDEDWQQFKPIYLFCWETYTRINTTESQRHDPKPVH